MWSGSLFGLFSGGFSRNVDFFNFKWGISCTFFDIDDFFDFTLILLFGYSGSLWPTLWYSLDVYSWV